MLRLAKGMVTNSNKENISRIIIVIVVSLVVMLAALLRIPWLGTTHYASGDELMWAHAARNVIIHPLFALNPTPRLPPSPVTSTTEYNLFNRYAAYPILMAVPIAIFGPNHFSLRLTNCLCGIALVLLIFILGRMTLGTEEGVAAALMLSTLPAAIMFSRMAYNEGLVTVLGLIVIAIVFHKEGLGSPYRAVLVGTLVGFAYLIKSIEILIIVGPALALFMVLRRDLKTLRWIFILGITAIIVVFIPLGLRALITPWTVTNGLNNLWFADKYPWQKFFGFYFRYLACEFSLLLPYIACGVLDILRRVTQPKADRRMLVWLAMVAMLVVISIPQTKKDTYSLLLIPAITVLAGAGLVFTSQLRSQGKIWRGVGAIALLGLPLLALALGLMPDPRHGPFVIMDMKFVKEWWPRALWLTFALNFIAIASALLKKAEIRVYSKWVTPIFLSGITLISGGVTWFGILEGQRSLATQDHLINRDWQSKAIVKLQADIKTVWPKKRLLVGQRAHAFDITFHYPPENYTLNYNAPAHIDVKDKINICTIIRQIKANKFPFYADSLIIQLRRFNKDKKLAEKISPEATKIYNLLLSRYKDITEWFRQRYGVNTSVRVYCLKHIEVNEIIPPLLSKSSPPN